VAEVKCLSARASPRVEIEELILLVPIEDHIEVAVAEVNMASDKSMGGLACESLYLLAELIGHAGAAKLVDELVIVDASVTYCYDFEGCDFILLLFGGPYNFSRDFLRHFVRLS
jgi:hypothetical protein